MRVAVLLVACALTKVATASGCGGSLYFECDGQPTAAAQSLAAKVGLRFIEGAPIVYPARAARLENPGCATVEFTVTREGLTDNFLVLDSYPKGFFEEAILESLKFWKFEPPPSTHRVILPISFEMERGVGSHLGTRKVARCVSPEVKISGRNLAQPEESPYPYYPPDLVAKRIEGCVTIAFEVQKDGVADDYGVIDSVPGETFVPTVVQALNDWRFDGVPAGRQGIWRFDFSILNESAATPAKGGCAWPKTPNLIPSKP